MKQLFYTLIISSLFSSCGTTRKDYLSHSDDDKTIYDAVKTLSKFPNDSLAIKAIPILYPLAQQRHLSKISKYHSDNTLPSREKIIDEYAILQKMYDAINDDGTASRLVPAVNYQTELTNSKEDAAEAYYLAGSNAFDDLGRDNAKKAWTYFKKADKLIPGYKDSKAKMATAYENAIVNVVIYPIQDNSFFFNAGWGNSAYNSNEYFQQNLVRELGKDARRYPAKFYTEWEARRNGITADWVVDLTLRNLDIPRPYGSTYTRNASQQIEVGRDSSGHVTYQTVYATVNITRQSFTARGQMDVEITEAGTRKKIANRSYMEDYRWQEEYADYSGDSRALSASDWQLVGNSRLNNQPNKEDVLSELYRRIYPQVKSTITNAADW